MVKGTMNQLYNIGNIHQTGTRRVLTVCSAGLLRSPTAADVLAKEYGYNTRACGTHDYALIPISEALIKWADEIVFVDKENYEALTPLGLEAVKEQEVLGAIITVLSVPDMYEWGNEELKQTISKQYKALT